MVAQNSNFVFSETKSLNRSSKGNNTRNIGKAYLQIFCWFFINTLSKIRQV